MGRPVVHWELMSKDPAKLAGFYEKIFGWKIQHMTELDVDDLAGYRKRIVAAGGKIHVEEQQVPGMGAFTLFTDPEGRMMGLWTSKKTKA